MVTKKARHEMSRRLLEASRELQSESQLLASDHALDEIDANSMYERVGSTLERIRSIEPPLADAADLADAGRTWSRNYAPPAALYVAYDDRDEIHAVGGSPQIAIRRAKLNFHKSVEDYDKWASQTAQPPLRTLPATAELARLYPLGYAPGMWGKLPDGRAGTIEECQAAAREAQRFDTPTPGRRRTSARSIGR